MLKIAEVGGKEGAVRREGSGSDVLQQLQKGIQGTEVTSYTYIYYIIH